MSGGFTSNTKSFKLYSDTCHTSQKAKISFIETNEENKSNVILNPQGNLRKKRNIFYVMYRSVYDVKTTKKFPNRNCKGTRKKHLQEIAFSQAETHLLIHVWEACNVYFLNRPTY